MPQLASEAWTSISQYRVLHNMMSTKTEFLFYVKLCNVWLSIMEGSRNGRWVWLWHNIKQKGKCAYDPGIMTQDGWRVTREVAEYEKRAPHWEVMLCMQSVMVGGLAVTERKWRWEEEGGGGEAYERVRKGRHIRKEQHHSVIWWMGREAAGAPGWAMTERATRWRNQTLPHAAFFHLTLIFSPHPRLLPIFFAPLHLS